MERRSNWPVKVVGEAADWLATTFCARRRVKMVGEAAGWLATTFCARRRVKVVGEAAATTTAAAHAFFVGEGEAAAPTDAFLGGRARIFCRGREGWLVLVVGEANSRVGRRMQFLFTTTTPIFHTSLPLNFKNRGRGSK